ncbi:MULTISPECIES: hypothetical protein [unclassified Wolbachia]|uniref:hypothetical protein n=1 Tax=unclassified Wolbachia TaxID=2640676 RepID=UPI002226CFF0|nr:hypothetical protein [Wolbachia endosymbiont (group A) of Ancistrocerus nigricornis]
MRYLLSEERCNKAIPVSSTGMTAILRHTAIHSIAVRTLSSRRVSSQRPYDVIPVLDTGI